MRLTFSLERYAQLLEELALAKENFPADPSYTVECLRLIKSALVEVSEMVGMHPFALVAEEAEFNKSGYLPFYGLYSYYVERFNLYDGMSRLSVHPKKRKVMQEYLYGKLGEWNRYLMQHVFLLECYRKSLSELDVLLFTSGGGLENLYLPESPEFHCAGVPPAVYVFARFVAIDRLTEEVLGMVMDQGEQDRSGVSDGDSSGSKRCDITWTGSKVGIAELAYGLYYTGQFNNGTADVKQISKWLEESLGLDMSSVHRKFIDVRRRNTASPTKLLDRMREAIQQRIDEDLAYKPNRGAKLNRPLEG